ncbi:MAG TPA: hypothetical protein VFM49_07025 [Chloroflexia bacterium]|jgi:hypothetical protein|nr:hypothetical protein [Chloroflexia bacterium]
MDQSTPIPEKVDEADMSDWDIGRYNRLRPCIRCGVPMLNVEFGPAHVDVPLMLSRGAPRLQTGCKALMCIECGYTELCAAQPQKLKTLWEQQHGR